MHWHYNRLLLNFIHGHMENVKSRAQLGESERDTR